mmetsp:Transcript_14865/g.20112  ORF Transcript_14865/g.20112 Transcript_14865/m.20112 type:complete len:179 (-) Transcript_14865:219-755(-)
MMCGPAFVCEYLHVGDDVYRDVYEPSEDSFLLIDALHVDLPDLVGRFGDTPISNVIEVGVGSGVVLTTYGLIWKQQCEQEQNATQNPLFWGSDINKRALAAAKDLLLHNNLAEEQLRLVEANLFNGVPQGQLFDVIIFNPPYVVTDQEELDRAQQERGIEAAWAGGKHGIEVLFDFLP